MEQKQIYNDQSSSYESFIAQNLESYNEHGINELRGRHVRACFHGWMILSNHSDSVLWSIWNPLTSKLIRLPPLVHNEKESHECCLSSHPDDQCSIFFLLPEMTPTIVFCWLNSQRKRLKWTKMSYAKQLRSITDAEDRILQLPTCYNGKVYAITKYLDYRHVIQIDIVVKGKGVVINLVPFVKLPFSGSLYSGLSSRNDTCSIYSFLKGWRAKIFYIDVCFKDDTRVDDVYLFELDMKSMTWVEMRDLKDGMILLEYSHDNSWSLYYNSSMASGIGGCVYILDDINKIIYSFNVKDRTISLSSMPCIVRESQVLVWAMLECRLEVDHPESMQDEHDKDTKEVHVIRQVKNYDETEFVSTTSESYLLNIPFHILNMIMKKCVGVEYIKFRATCKRCYSAAPPIQWGSELTALRMHSVDSPWLIVLDNYQGIITFIDPMCTNKYFIKIPRELIGDWQIYCSRYGWLLMYDFKRRQGPVFFNPFTKNIRTLPAVGEYIDSFCFSAPPTSPDCMVVGFKSLGTTHVCIHFVSQEPPSWHKYSLDSGSNNDRYSFHIPTFEGKVVYTLCNNERIDAFRDIHDDGYSYEVFKDKAPISSCVSPRDYFLSKCDQHLLFVIVGQFGESVEVFKLNDSTKEWDKMDDLGTHMIYISETSCICREAKSPQMGNKVYFPRTLHNDDTKIVFYSLKTCKYHTFDNSNNIEENFAVGFFGSKAFSHPHTWIEPSWS